MNNMLKVLAVMGMGAGAFMIYKMYNPECVHEMKDTLDKLTKNASKSVKNMMQ